MTRGGPLHSGDPDGHTVGQRITIDSSTVELYWPLTRLFKEARVKQAKPLCKPCEAVVRTVPFGRRRSSHMATIKGGLP